MGFLTLHALLTAGLSVCLTAQVPAFLAPLDQVRFDSMDYRNILRWTPTASNTSTQYYVQWKIYGEPHWVDVLDCQGILNSCCDLSDMTAEPREWYYARVIATSLHGNRSAWALSRRFSPHWDTTITPPVLKVRVTEQGIVVRVKSTRSLLKKTHKKLYYKIYLFHTDGEEEEFELDASTKQLVIGVVGPRTKYCLQARTVIYLQGKSSDRSSTQCVITL